MRKTVLMLLGALLPASAQAARPSTLLSEPPPASAKLNEVLTFKARQGYHFNQEAPQECGRGEVIQVTTGTVRCQFTGGGRQDVVLKLCSDKSPRCMFEEFTLTVEGAPAAASRKAAAAALPEEPGLPGFLANRPEAALKAAKESGKPLFIDFSAKWCPSCRLMEDTALIDPAFIAASSGMVRLSLDVDMPAARQLMSRFKINSYPTFIVADHSLKEIGRVVGSMSPEAFARWTAQQQAWKDSPIEAAKAAAKSLDEAGKMRVIRAYMAGGEWARAMELLQGVASPRRAYLAHYCRIAAAEDAGDRELPALYGEGIAKYSGYGGAEAEMGVVEWMAAVHKADPARPKEWMDGMDALAERLKASAGAREDGYLPSEIYVAIGDAMGGAGLESLSLDFYGRAAAEYAAMAAAAPKPGAAKGLRMCAARYLVLAGRHAEAAAAYAALTADHPGEYAFFRSYSGTLRKLRKYPEALRAAEKAAGLAYGDVKLDILLMKAEMELESGDRAAALRTADAAIAAAELPADPRLRTHGVYRRLKEFRRKAAEGS